MVLFVLVEVVSALESAQQSPLRFSLFLIDDIDIVVDVTCDSHGFLDLVADSPSRALWRYPSSPTLGPFAQNISLIWCALSNWGGAVHVGGDIGLVLNETRAAMETPHVVGVGLTPECVHAH